MAVGYIYSRIGQYSLQKRKLESAGDNTGAQLRVGVDGGHGSWVHWAPVLGQHDFIHPLTKLRCYLGDF